jgi:hypothetical protein
MGEVGERVVEPGEKVGANEEVRFENVAVTGVTGCDNAG